MFSSKQICANFINRAGTITLAYIYPGDPFMEGTSFELRALPAPPSAAKFPAALEKTKLPVFGNYGPYAPPPQLTVAYWFLLLGYLIPWNAAIYWWQYRKAIPA
jgi:hypothetical protein